MKIFKIKKKAQEEMVGFALIIILVMVLLLIFLGISLNQPERDSVESFEAENFLKTVLQTTTQCRDSGGYVSLLDLTFMCGFREYCLDEDLSLDKDSCLVLNETFDEILEESWNVGPRSVVKGYNLKIFLSDDEIFDAFKGNLTRNAMGASQTYQKSGEMLEFFFTLYY